MKQNSFVKYLNIFLIIFFYLAAFLFSELFNSANIDAIYNRIGFLLFLIIKPNISQNPILCYSISIFFLALIIFYYNRMVDKSGKNLIITHIKTYSLLLIFFVANILINIYIINTAEFINNK